MLKRVLFFTFTLIIFSFISNTEVSAQCVGGGSANITCLSDTGTLGSETLSFDPTASLMSAVINTDPTNGPCFTCPNTVAGANGTTAGALTNSMFGEIRLNSNADLGNQSFAPFQQGMTIPRATGCGSTLCNDSGAFSFSLPLPTQDFLSAGSPVASTTPDPGVPVGTAGMRVEMTNDFTYNADGTSAFVQSVKQATFTGGAEGNALQEVDFSAIGDNNIAFPGITNGIGGTLAWTQTIEEGDFFLGPLSGQFTYNENFSFEFDGASAPTGASQANGSNNIIGFP